MTKEQVYFELLARTDHPVLTPDYSPTTSIGISSPLNSVLNLVYARELVKLKALVDEIRLNINPTTVTALTIDDWENQYFNFTKPSSPLATRRAELLIKVNKRFSMSVPDVLSLALSVAGSPALVTRNLNRSGWVLGQGALGVSTSFGGGSAPDQRAASVGLYLVSFLKPISSTLLQILDQRLTDIEKAGSRHRVKAPIQKWVLGKTALGVDTTL